MTARIETGRHVEVAPGIRLHHAVAGPEKAPLLLFVHGFPEAWFAWEEALGRFGHAWRAVAPDLRGYNLSSKPAGLEPYRPGVLTRDLLGLIRALGYERATVIAHDWGGALAWQLAIRHPEAVERLVILNAPHPVLFARALAGDPDQQRASEYMNWLRRPGAENVLAQENFRRLDAMFTDHGVDASWYTPELRRRYHAAWSTPGEAGSHPLAGALAYYRASPLHPPAPGAPMAVPEFEPAAWRTRVPVRVIWGEADTALLPSLLDGLDDWCADLAVTRVPAASHWLVHERPGEVLGLIERALAD